MLYVLESMSIKTGLFIASIKASYEDMKRLGELVERLKLKEVTVFRT